MIESKLDRPREKHMVRKLALICGGFVMRLPPFRVFITSLISRSAGFTEGAVVDYGTAAFGYMVDNRAEAA